MSIKTETIRQSVLFKMSPQELYDILMDPEKHSALTGSKVKISPEVGGEFRVYDGEIEGKNLELVPGKKIVQSWRYSDWPEGHYSRCTFSMRALPVGTRLTFTQSGVPEDVIEDIRQGWRDYYWDPIKAQFEK